MNPEKEHAEQSQKEESGFYISYESHAKTLRNWLIFYGIAVPAYFIKEPVFAARFLVSGITHFVLLVFMAGLLLQLLEVFLYKIAMGYLYLGELDDDFKNSTKYKWSSKFSNLTWPIVLCDGGTIFLYFMGTWKILSALAASPC